MIGIFRIRTESFYKGIFFLTALKMTENVNIEIRPDNLKLSFHFLKSGRKACLKNQY
jgi:hypothetical protein